jgi:hypothetical protein
MNNVKNRAREVVYDELIYVWLLADCNTIINVYKYCI